MRRGAASSGFSLLEALVALGIAAAVMSGFYEALSTGARLDARAERQAEQVLVATTVMDRIGIDLPMRPGSTDNGELRGLKWDLVIGTSPAPDMQLGVTYPGELLVLAVTVQGRQGDGPVTLRAIRYAGDPL